MTDSLSPQAMLKIEYRDIGTLKPNPNNARRHSRSQIRLIASSLDKFDWIVPLILAPDSMILCGHGRYEAALLLGMKTVPTIMLEHLSEADRRAYVIMDNASAEQAGWSDKMLAIELSGLLEIGYDLEFTGLSQLRIDTILSMDDAEEPVDDDVHLPGEQDEPVTQLGDVWDIGVHRLIVGDACDPAVFERLLRDEKVQMVITDPPYGCAIENNVSGNGRVRHGNFLMGAGETSLPEFASTLIRPVFKNIASVCESGAIAFVFTDWRAAPHMLTAAEGVFEEPKQMIVWAKTNGGQGTFYRSAHELIYAFRVSPGRIINNFKLGAGGRYRTNVWTYPGANVFRAGRMQDLADHPTVKPKKMIADAILDCSKRGGIILDAFAGSGTTLCAAAMTGRVGRGIELDPKYADVALRRVEAETGEVAMLDGVPFDEVAAQRRAARKGG